MADPAQPRPPAASASTNFAVAPISKSVDDTLHELRVRIPVDLHRQLLSLKILRGASLAETVAMALDIYFEDLAREAATASDDR